MYFGRSVYDSCALVMKEIEKQDAPGHRTAMQETLSNESAHYYVTIFIIS